MNIIYVVSDGTGRTAEQILMAALTQFPGTSTEVMLKGEVRSERQIEEIVAEVAACKGVIVHTLVSDMLRESILRISRIHNVDAIDLMGPLLSRLTHHFADSPTGEPGLFFSLNKLRSLLTGMTGKVFLSTIHWFLFPILSFPVWEQEQPILHLP